MKKLLALAVAAPALVLGPMSAAHAELSEAVTTGITTAQTDLIALYAAMTVAGIAVFVVAVVYRKFTLK